MYITTLRPSAYGTWNICQFQYFLTYCLGIQDKSGKAAIKGTICHLALECLALLKQEQDKGKKGLCLYIHDKLGMLSVPAYLDNNNKIPRLVEKSFNYHTHISKTTHSFDNGDLKDCIKWVTDTIEFGNGMFDPRLRDVLSTELYFEITMEQEWAKYKYFLPNGETLEGNLVLHGTIDLLTKINDNVIEMIDWKTGRRIDWSNYKEKNWDRLSVDPQLMMYYYAQPCGKDKIYIVTIFWSKDGGPFTMTFDDSHLVSTENMIKNRFQTIQKCQNPRRKGDGESSFCKRVCYYNKTCMKDSNKSICKFIYDEIQKTSMDDVLLKYTPEGFQLGYYHRGS